MSIDSDTATPTPASPSGGRVSGNPRFYLTNEFGLICLIVVFGLIFALLAKNFFSPFNLFALGRVAAVNVMIGFAMMVVIVTGGLNLAVGAIGVCGAMFCGFLIQVLGLPWPLAILLGLGLGAGLGFINGFAVVRSGLHSFIITLATMSIFFGAMVFLTRAESFRGLPPIFSAFGTARLFGFVSPLLIVAALVGVLLSIMYRYTVVGREMLAAGAKPEAAALSGVPVGRTIILCHMLSGSLAALTALLVMARNGAAIPSMAGQLGQDWLLPAFLGPVLGGTLLSGGRASPLGTFLGAILVTMLTNGLLLLRVGEFWVQACLGVLLLFAVLVDKARRSYLAHLKVA
ncbi:MAG: ABC transporter permease [Rhizobiales bacterium]|nr:ABC transporter permease [Hyphomicrobiales bacterium]